MYYRGAQAAIVVYDITNEVSTNAIYMKLVWISIFDIQSSD
jgi:GTPase SAR1 family protein